MAVELREREERRDTVSLGKEHSMCVVGTRGKSV